jgi:hypothetical protein
MYEFEEDYEEYEPPIPKRRATISHDVSYYDRPTEELKRPPPKHATRPRRMTFRAFFLTGMILMLSLWAIATYIIIPWITGIENHWNYGQSLIYETSGNVGHGGTSMFISFEGSGNQVVVIEAVGNKYKVYTGPIVGSAPQRTIVTVQLVDVNNDGKLDLIIHIEGTDGSFALINTGTDFKWGS